MATAMIVDKAMRYRSIARRVVTEYASYKLSYGDVSTEVIIDEANGHYLVTHIGWDHKNHRVYGTVIHLDLIEDKLWIQQDTTDWPVAEALLEAGVPREDIVLGFQPAKLRPLTEFAAA